jgi:prevent-host-death family protein
MHLLPLRERSRLVTDRSKVVMSAKNVIAASEAKAKFSELLDRVQRGESFSITLHGEEAAKLVPARRSSREEIQAVIAEIKSSRRLLNPPGKPKLRIKDLINEGRK